SSEHVRDAGVRINGGFFALRSQIFDYINDGEDLVEEPFQRLAAEGKLLAHQYDGFWACMDTFREKQLLEDMYSRGQVPWEVWKPRFNLQKATAWAFLEGASSAHVVVHDYRDGFLPYSGAAVKDEFEALKREFSPDLVFTHYRDDRHQDHRLISELTWNTWRDHLILEYEVPK